MANFEFAKSLIESSQTKQMKRRLHEEEEKIDIDVIDDIDDVEEVDEVEEEEEEIKNPDGFEETIEDDVYWCDVCHKHFIASPETPQSEIACPVCDSDESIVLIGSAADAVEDSDEEAEEITVEIDDADDSEIEEEEVEESARFDESSLNEGLTAVAKRHMSKNMSAKVLSGVITREGNLVLRGRVGRKPMTITFEGFKSKMGKKSFVCEGTSDMFKKTKLKAQFVREGKALKVKSFGYGLIRESKDGKVKARGIVGEK